nr:retrovirus-related Pol polyprotein from transposon TNT 1-94 [Tanacetum cinerariifolium]GEY36569.1 retrovirus-related Pol polyprotein from transposon TNT 1-94 [Tanacetum cinerariifolium]
MHEIFSLSLMNASREELRCLLMRLVIPKVFEKNNLSKSVTSHLNTKKIIKNCTKVLALGLLKIEYEPINAYFKNNRVVHRDYLNVTKEHVATLHELLEEARALKPLDEHIGHASKFVERIQELLVYVNALCPFNQSGNEKWDPATSHRKNDKPYLDASRMKNTIEKITQKHVVKQNTRKIDNTMLPSTGRVRFVNATGSKPKSNKKNDMIPQPSSRSMRNKVEAHHRKFKSSANKNNHVLYCNANIKKIVPPSSSYNNTSAIVVPPGQILTTTIIEIVLCYLDSGCSKHMTGHRDKLINFVSKFIGTLRFGNDHFAAIMRYGDLQMRNILISRIYYVEGLGHNLFSVGQFSNSNLEVAFRKHTCFVRNLEGVDPLSCSSGSNHYTISMADMMKCSPIFLLSKASKTKSCFLHLRLSHLNFGTINQLAKQGLIKCLPKLKYTKDHLCSTCKMGKSKKESQPHKPKPSTNEKLQMLHMDLCGPMWVESINKKRYILIIIDNYSRFTWVKFLRTKDEAPEIIIKILKQAQVSLNATVRYLRTDNGTEFLNQTLRNYMKDVAITHHTSIARTLQQNGVVERCNHTLVEVARTMLIFSKSLLFLLAEVVATACNTQNRSIIHTRYNKTPYELLRDRKPELKNLHVFGALCYPTNDFEDLRKLQPKANIGIIISYSPSKKAYQIYKKGPNR